MVDLTEAYGTDGEFLGMKQIGYLLLQRSIGKACNPGVDQTARKLDPLCRHFARSLKQQYLENESWQLGMVLIDQDKLASSISNKPKCTEVFNFKEKSVNFLCHGEGIFNNILTH